MDYYMRNPTQNMKNGESKFTIVLFGKKSQLKDIIVKLEDSKTFKIIPVDLFDEECLHPDQQIIDCMARSYPGPHLFILDQENNSKEEVKAQIKKLKTIFGEEVMFNLNVMFSNMSDLSHMKEELNIKVAISNKNLSSECTKWCLNHRPFVYKFNDYSECVILRRRFALDKKRSSSPPPYDTRADAELAGPSSPRHAAAAPVEAPVGSGRFHWTDTAGHRGNGATDHVFTIILLGLTGTGKSASANTILAAGNSGLHPKQRFKSESSSMPVTQKCEAKTVKLSRTEVRVVDTPDFFHEQLGDVEADVQEFQKYYRSGRCMVLLVIQLSRFTDEERGLLEKLEKKLHCSIRENAVVLLTHAEDLEGSVQQFIGSNDHLKNIIEQCGDRCHLFNNNSKKPQQVLELIRKVPKNEEIFQVGGKAAADCCLC